MLVILLAWAIASPGAATCALPEGFEQALVIHDASTAKETVAAFCAGGQLRTLATAVAGLRDQSRQAWAIDVLDPRALGLLGVKSHAPIAVLWPTQKSLPVLALGSIDAGAMEQNLAQMLAGRYATARTKELHVLGQTLRALTLGDTVTPRVLWGTAKGQTYVAGPRNKEALAKVLSLASFTVDDWAHKTPSATAARPTVTVLRRQGAQSQGPHTSFDLALSATGLDGVAPSLWAPTAALPQEAAPWCSQVRGARASATAARLHEILQEQALAVVSGPSLQMAHSLAPMAPWLQAEGARGAAKDPSGAQSAIMRRLQKLVLLAPKLAQATQGLDVPFAAAVWGRELPGPPVPWRDRMDFAVVARGHQKADFLQLKLLKERLVQLYGAKSKACDAPGITLAKGHAHECLLILGQPMTLFTTEDALMLISGGRMVQLHSKLMGPLLPKDTHGDASATAQAHLDVDFAALSSFFEHIVMMESGRVLGTDGSGGGLRQLMMLGPTGDIIREIGGLGRGWATLQCDGDRPSLRAGVRFAKEP